MGRSSRQKINRQRMASNVTLDQIDIIDVYGTFHPQNTENIFLASAHRTLFIIDHILGHKTSLKKFSLIEIMSSIFSDYNGIKLDINYR